MSAQLRPPGIVTECRLMSVLVSSSIPNSPSDRETTTITGEAPAPVPQARRRRIYMVRGPEWSGLRVPGQRYSSSLLASSQPG